MEFSGLDCPKFFKCWYIVVHRQNRLCNLRIKIYFLPLLSLRHFAIIPSKYYGSEVRYSYFMYLFALLYTVSLVGAKKAPTFIENNATPVCPLLRGEGEYEVWRPIMWPVMWLAQWLMSPSLSLCLFGRGPSTLSDIFILKFSINYFLLFLNLRLSPLKTVVGLFCMF